MIFMAVIGLVFLFIGLIARMGGMKGLYLIKGQSFVVPEVIKYVFMPFGIYCISIFLFSLIPDSNLRSMFFRFVGFPMLITTLGLSLFQPRWLLPYWLNYLRTQYGEHTTRLLLTEASKDIPTWEKQVATHEGLVEWAESTLSQLREN